MWILVQIDVCAIAGALEIPIPPSYWHPCSWMILFFFLLCKLGCTNNEYNSQVQCRSGRDRVNKEFFGIILVPVCPGCWVKSQKAFRRACLVDWLTEWWWPYPRSKGKWDKGSWREAMSKRPASILIEEGEVISLWQNQGGSFKSHKR